MGNRMINKKILKKFLSLLDKSYDINSCLDKFPDYREQLKEYSDAIGSLVYLRNIKPDEDFTKKTLKRIHALTRIDTIENDKNAARRDLVIIRLRPVFLKPLIVFLSVFLFLSFSFAGTVYASGNSVPGDILYPVKRTSENMQIVFTPYTYEGGLYFKFLNKRLKEADILSKSDKVLDIELAESLLNDINYTYGKCMEHKYFGTSNGEAMGMKIMEIKEDLMKKCKMQKNQ